MSAPSAAQSPVAAAPAAPAEFGAWGVDLSARDLSVKPGDDFQLYTSGSWLARTEIPADRPSVGTFYDLREKAQDQVKQIITGNSASPYGALYASFMDEARLETLGLKPLMVDLAKVKALASKRDFARFMGSTHGGFGVSLVSTDIGPDTVNPEVNVLWLGQDGLGLPTAIII